ncbi:MAG: bifunctional 5,10-methylene-tetrahydrofolate dehydrogenase/5,10-methylene-tetrahydrofolate cyclohydrolase [Elusimicrobia bacterium CG11_big_fil_rev_8_21_14_0_20_64_6]|nr:MAG: bifunctional 5,10-methylene-tetrahydrofolate dehydrogenase/5,10-methylene-tetrahydrofolate cyclohydrolase [Elusimicrobia bacterium CG11_big_fil_rev_8_21_14_0_20_64_6]
MSAHIFSGRPLAIRLMSEARRRALKVAKKRGRAPRLAIVAAADAAAGSYLKIKLRACESSGVDAIVHRLSPASRTKTIGLLADLAADPSADALIIETPYPRGLTVADAASVIPPEKDAEGITAAAFGRLFLAKTWKETRDLVVPCTALAIARLALASGVTLAGRRAVVIGRSATVGRPAAHLLSTLDMTVTLAHASTKGLAALCREADVLVLAAGVPGLVKASWVKRGALVLDAGVNLVRGRLKGDASPAVASRARTLTPVPGGVGPVTTACAVLNAVLLAERRTR